MNCDYFIMFLWRNVVVFYEAHECGSIRKLWRWSFWFKGTSFQFFFQFSCIYFFSSIKSMSLVLSFLQYHVCPLGYSIWFKYDNWAWILIGDKISKGSDGFDSSRAALANHWYMILKLLQHVEVPVPTAKKDEILLKLEATSLNLVDWKI